MADEFRRVHGGPDLDELRAARISPESILDFSVNVNPYGPTPRMRDAIRNAAIERYPDPTAGPARVALARLWDVAPEGVVLGAGAADLLWTLTRAAVRAGESVVVAGPTFSEARAAADAVGAIVHEVRATAEAAFRHDPEQLAREIHARRARLVYLCAPNNPTGRAWPLPELSALVGDCPDALFAIDQSFLSLSERHADAAVALPDNAVRVRSLTKDHAVPGTRVGAALTTPALASRLERMRPAWSTGAATQAAAIAATEEQAFVVECRARLLDDRTALLEGLRALGLSPCSSSTVFVLVRVGDACAVRGRLLHDARVLVRDCASFGLPEHVRIAARGAADRARLLEALPRALRP
ncbi:MAG: putative Histidinol-phosphate transaminase [Myxococcales bacterium]|nr:putative Histidinol-phosphate transaminase [Myxococcales bacterium]